jgi:hypothetical protein
VTFGRSRLLGGFSIVLRPDHQPRAKRTWRARGIVFNEVARFAPALRRTPELRRLRGQLERAVR